MKKIIFPTLIFLVCISCTTTEKKQSLFDLARANKDILKVSTILTAQDVRDRLSTDPGIDSAIHWCKEAGITRVFLEEFRSNFTADRKVLEHARDRFESEGIEASGGITTTIIGKPSSSGSIVSCYTDQKTCDELKEKMEYAASMFDVIMIDDFLFTDCECDECKKAAGDMPMWEYRCNLMDKVSEEYMLKPALAVNPNVKVIIKYPQWYDDFHRRGYDVDIETKLFPIIWVGTETRDSDLSRTDRGWEKPQYEGYYIMRWLGAIGGDKTGGGWFDALGTTPVNYLEQARQTVLGGAKEMMLFSFGGLHREKNNYGHREGTGVADLEALKTEMPALFKLATLIKDKPIKGISAPKIPNSSPYLQAVNGKDFYTEKGDAYIYDFIGMMGFPLVPSGEITTDVPAAFFPLQSLKDPQFREKLNSMLAQHKPVMISQTLDSILGHPSDENLIVLTDNGNLRNLVLYDRSTLNSIRDKMLTPFGVTFDAPSMVTFYLIGEDMLAVENFNNGPVGLKIGMDFHSGANLKLTLPEDSVTEFEASQKELAIKKLPARTLAVFQF